MAGLPTDIITAVVSTWAAATLALAARVFAKRMTKVRWWLDDYFCIASFLFCCGYSGVMVYWAESWYLGRNIPDEVGSDRYEVINMRSRLMQFLVSFTYSYAIGFCKLSVLLFYWRIFQLSAIRTPILITVVITVCWLILRTFMVIFRCVPVQAYWNKSIEGAKCDINDSQFFFGTCLTHFVLDVVILALPIIEVIKLRLRLGQKLAIAALFLVGFIVCVASVFVIITSIQYDVKTTQMPHDIAWCNTWGCIEINVAIVSACFPLLRPIFKVILPSKLLSSFQSSHPISRSARVDIRLETISRTLKKKEEDESSSTYGLADHEQEAPRDYTEGPQTIISSETDDYNSSHEYHCTGIYVRRDMMIEVEDAKPDAHIVR
ncbi:related to integral membrane protein [Fusarium mangiferae]|uniref:Related to integral membrane protein n=1 Tax=Fusarium mangiferae TaxID=192010 RepID=A0A1L7UFK2_FUSMA|nr:uncharacterized protein FMAN_15438 [Fusarium mangiferae]CVL09169.1 related to integral membrane protein [Fusarium mangiferae]